MTYKARNVPSQLSLASRRSCARRSVGYGILACDPGAESSVVKRPFELRFGDTSLITAVSVTALNYFFFRRLEKRRRGV